MNGIAEKKSTYKIYLLFPGPLCWPPGRLSDERENDTFKLKLFQSQILESVVWDYFHIQYFKIF